MANAAVAQLKVLARAARTPGIQYVAVGRDAVLLEYHDGLADISTRRPMRATTSMMAYSMSKTITAAAALQLVEAGRVGLDDPIARHLDDQPYGTTVTVRQLISHTSGIPNPLPLRWVHPAASHGAFDERAALSLVLRAHPRLAFAPGSRYAYSNIGYWLLGRIIETASGVSFTSYVMDRVLRPAGIAPGELDYAIDDPLNHASGYLERFSLMNLALPLLVDRELVGERAGRWVRIREHYLNGPPFGGLVGSATGFGKFLRDQLQDHSRLFGDATRLLFREPQRTTGGRDAGMTLGWHIGSRAGTSFLFKEGGGAGFRSMMRLYPERRIGTVVMANATGFSVRGALDAVDPCFLR